MNVFYVSWNDPETVFHDMFWKKNSQCILPFKNFANFTRKHLCLNLFLIKLQTWRPVTLFKRDSNKSVLLRCFPVNFAKFPRTPFLQNTSGWLLLLFSRTTIFYARPNIFFNPCERDLDRNSNILNYIMLIPYSHSNLNTLHYVKSIRMRSFFLVRIFLYLVLLRENTDHKKIRIWIRFTQWFLLYRQRHIGASEWFEANELWFKIEKTISTYFFPWTIDQKYYIFTVSVTLLDNIDPQNLLKQEDYDIHILRTKASVEPPSPLFLVLAWFL